MAEDSIRVVPDSVNQAAGSGTTPGKLVKTFGQLDGNGNAVEVQAVALVDQAGQPYQPMTEGTAQQLLTLLRAIDLKLALVTGTLPAPDSAGLTQN